MTYCDLVQLQSGFVTIKNDILTKSKPRTVSDIVNNAVLGQTKAIAPPSPYVFSVDVVELYTKFLSDHNVMKDFDYRERILVTFKNLISHRSFKDWIDHQLSSKMLTQLHRKFLLDTINYIQTGERKVAVESWYRIITPREASLSDKTPEIRSGEYFNAATFSAFKGQSDPFGYDYSKLDPDINEVITRWVSHNAGYVDLLYFLVLVYGEY